MPNVRAVGPGAKIEDLPLLNAPEFEEEEKLEKPDGFESPPSSGSSWHPPTDSDEDPEEVRRRHEPDDEGKFWDDPLWYGKTRKEIEYATELEKSNGNAASREGDWKKAKRYWKNALRGAEKIQDAETEFRLHSNLALAYIKQKKIDKSLEHCEQALKERLKVAVSADLRGKVHYRRAEAYEAAGEVSKAIASCKLSLEVHPDNADVRKKLAALKLQEAEQRKREKALFSGLRGLCGRRCSDDPNEAPMPPPPPPPPEADSSDEERPVADDEDDSYELTEEQQRMLEAGLTDRDAAARLVNSIGAAKHDADDLSQPSNMTVGPEIFWSPEMLKGTNVRQSMAA